MNKTITDILNITPTVVPTIIHGDNPFSGSSIVNIDEKDLLDVIPDEKGVEDTEETKAIDQDFELVRSNLKSLVEKGEDALEQILNLADSTAHPRAYEVAFASLKTLVDSNLSIMDIHEKKKRLKEPKKGEEPKQVTNNTAIFNGSTSDILKLMKK